MCVFLESVNVCLFIHVHIGLFLKGSEVGPYIFTEWQPCAPHAQLHARCMLIHIPSGGPETGELLGQELGAQGSGNSEEPGRGRWEGGNNEKGLTGDGNRRSKGFEWGMGENHNFLL